MDWSVSCSMEAALFLSIPDTISSHIPFCLSLCLICFFVCIWITLQWQFPLPSTYLSWYHTRSSSLFCDIFSNSTLIRITPNTILSFDLNILEFQWNVIKLENVVDEQIKLSDYSPIPLGSRHTLFFKVVLFSVYYYGIGPFSAYIHELKIWPCFHCFYFCTSQIWRLFDSIVTKWSSSLNLFRINVQSICELA